MIRRYLALSAAALAIAALGAGLWTWRSAPPDVPDVRYTLLDGRSQTLSDLRGKVVLVNFWATTCTICVKEMPLLVSTHQQFQGRGVETLAVAMQHDPPAAVADFAESRRLPFGVVIDNTGAMARAFDGVRATPTTFVLNHRGEVVMRHLGQPDFDQLHRLLDELLRDAG